MSLFTMASSHLKLRLRWEGRDRHRRDGRQGMLDLVKYNIGDPLNRVVEHVREH